MPSSTVALLVVAVMLAAIAYLLSQRNAQDAAKANEKPAADVIVQEPVYDYPVSYVSDYYWTPWRSYGSIYDYRRYHGYPRNPYRYRQAAFDGARHMGPYVRPRSSPPVMPHTPSMVPRAGMSHPTAPHGRRR